MSTKKTTRRRPARPGRSATPELSACPPAHLNECAKKKWLEIVDAIDPHARGAADLLELYVIEWTRWIRAENQIAAIGEVVKSPTGFAQPNPWLAISRQAHDRLAKLSKRLAIDKPVAAAQDRPKSNTQRTGLSNLRILG